jgi:WD40 repeat protein
MLLYEDHNRSPVFALAFSPDGTALASGARDGSLLLRTADGHTHPVTERGPNSPPIYSVGFLPDGSALVIGHARGWHVYRTAGGTWRLADQPPERPVTSLAVLDARTLAVGTGDRVKRPSGTFELWDLPSGRKIEPHFQEPNGVRAVTVCPAKKVVAWATGYRKVKVWDVRKQDPIEFPQQTDYQAIALSPDGTRLAVALDRPVRLFDVEKRREHAVLRGHTGRVEAVAFSPDGATVATGSWDQTVRLWDAATGRERARFNWPIGRVFSLAFAPDGLRLAAGGDTGAVVVWDLE